MDAYVIRKFGDTDVFEKANVPTPQLYPGQVLIEVLATSVNPLDCKIRQGKLPALAPEFPAVLHGDVSGVIREVGDQAAEFSVGDEVYAYAGGVKGSAGALAEYILVDTDSVAHKPKNISHREAAALPLIGITAWIALVDKAQIKPKQKILIHGATGGVGHIGIQLAKAAGATVYATCSSDGKAAIARDFGADYTINYRQTDVATYVDKYTNGKGFDVVFDTVGGDNLQRAFAAAAVNAIVVSTSARSTQDLSLMHSKGLTLHAVFMLLPFLHNKGRAHHGEILSQITRMVEGSLLNVLVDNSNYNMADVAKAHARQEAGENLGKIVLEL